MISAFLRHKSPVLTLWSLIQAFSFSKNRCCTHQDFRNIYQLKEAFEPMILFLKLKRLMQYELIDQKYQAWFDSQVLNLDDLSFVLITFQKGYQVKTGLICNVYLFSLWYLLPISSFQASMMAFLRNHALLLFQQK